MHDYVLPSTYNFNTSNAPTTPGVRYGKFSPTLFLIESQKTVTQPAL